MGELTEATILFADLSGFTALTEAHGDLTAVDLLERFMHWLRLRSAMRRGSSRPSATR